MNLFSKKTALLVALCVSSSFGTIEVTLENAVIKESGSSRMHPVCFAGFQDNRQEKALGYSMTASNKKSRDVIALNSVADWANQEMLQRLTAQGYIVKKDCLDSTSALQITGSIDSLQTKANHVYFGDIALTLQVTYQGKQLLNKQFVGNSSGSFTGALNARLFSKVASKVLGNAITNALAVINNIDNNADALLSDTTTIPVQVDSVATNVQVLSGIDSNTESILPEGVLASETRFNAKQGQVWLGGSFSYLTMNRQYKVEERTYDYYTRQYETKTSWVKGNRAHMVSFSPISRFFPANNFCFGPKFGWMSTFGKDYSSNAINLGGDIGFVGSGNSVLPYFIVSPHALIMGVSYTYSSSSYGDRERDTSITHFVLPLTAGLIIPLSGSGVAMQLEVGYSMSFEEYQKQNMFSIGVGVSGLGRKIAVSFLNAIGIFGGMF
jgi:hypothetical protein